MNWMYLIIAGLFEVGFVYSFAKIRETPKIDTVPWVISLTICLALSWALLYKAIKVIPIGTAYAVWTGIGAAGSVLIGILFFEESTDFWRTFFLITLILSIVGLRYVS